MITKLQTHNLVYELRKVSSNQSFLSSLIETKKPNKPERSFTNNEKVKIVIEGQSRDVNIDDLCNEYGIATTRFYEWSREFLNGQLAIAEPEEKTTFTEDEKFRIVLEGQNGQYSVAEICRKEGITQKEYLDWSNEFLKIRVKRIEREEARDKHTFKVHQLISDQLSNEALRYFESFIDVTSKTTFVATSNGEISNIESGKISNLVGLAKINDVRHINKHFELINRVMNDNGVFIGCLETFSARRQRKNINKIPVVNELYFGIEFFLKRILPKLNITKKFYFSFTQGKDRLMSKAEGLGRLVSCGFRIMDVNSINGLTYFVVKKVSDPVYDQCPSYGPLYKMPRLGKNGKIIKVYKLRTMHPYSEYLQDYMIKANGYADSGKPAGDFRIPKWGKVMRRFWLDEIPQIFNVLKGEMKVVGIRPVSKRYFQDIPKEMQKLRLTQKPGCIPPYVSLNRDGNVMSVLQAEKEYLVEKIRNPFFTDLKYFFKAIFNILFKHKRSA